MFIYNFRWFTHERKERPSSSKEDLSQPPPKIFFGTFWCFFTFKLLFLCLVGQYLLLYYYYTTAYNFVLKIYIILLSNITKYYYYYNTYNYQFNNTSVQMKKKVDTIQTYKFWVLDMKWNVKKQKKTFEKVDTSPYHKSDNNPTTKNVQERSLNCITDEYLFQVFF